MFGWLVRVGVMVGVVVWFGVSGAGGAGAGGAGLSDPSVLTVHEGSYTATTDGEVVENLEIRGSLRIAANDVTVRNVWVYTTSFWTVYVESGSATFENMEIGNADVVGERGIGGNNIVARSLDIHSVLDGIKIGSNVLYEGVRVHDLRSSSANPHADAVQADGGSSNAVIRNSVLDSTGPLANGNAAVILKSDLGPLNNITFTNNYLNGGNYTVYVRDGGYGMPTNVTFRDNTIGPDRTYGLVSDDGPFVWENNVDSQTGEVLDKDGNPIGGGTTTTTTAASTSTTTTTPATSTTTTTTDGATTTLNAIVASEFEERPDRAFMSVVLIAVVTSGLVAGIGYVTVVRKR